MRELNFHEGVAEFSSIIKKKKNNEKIDKKKFFFQLEVRKKIKT